MNWRKIKISVLLILGLVIIIPSILYLNAIDWSKKHSTRVNELPVFSDSVDSGEFRLMANNLEFLVRVAGMQNEGPAVILLHGFPESSIMWLPLLDSAAANGYRVIAFDQRGYSPNARPSDREAYQIDHLVNDVLGVANQVGFDRFHLVGHDWGAVVGWKTTMDFPDRIHTWTALTIPHIEVFFDSVLNHPEQQKRSAYIKKLQTPFLPELLFHLNQDKFFKKKEDIWTPEQIAEYKAIHQEHGATTAALNWYRAMDVEKVISEKSLKKKITRPTLFLWGTHDPVIAPEIISEQKKLINAPFKITQLEAEHSLMQAKTDSVVQLILSHFGN